MTLYIYIYMIIQLYVYHTCIYIYIYIYTYTHITFQRIVRSVTRCAICSRSLELSPAMLKDQQLETVLTLCDLTTNIIHIIHLVFNY